jgi:hypothetical protein
VFLSLHRGIQHRLGGGGGLTSGMVVDGGLSRESPVIGRATAVGARCFMGSGRAGAGEDANVGAVADGCGGVEVLARKGSPWRCGLAGGRR